MDGLALPLAGSDALTETEIAELERLLAEHRDELKRTPQVYSAIVGTRWRVQDALLAHADVLVAAARARLPGRPMPPQEVSWDR